MPTAPASWKWTPPEEDEDRSPVLLIEEDEENIVRIVSGDDSIRLFTEEALGLLECLTAWVGR